MTDLLPPAPKFSISKWLLGVTITTALIGGGIGAVAVTMMADGFFNVGRDPVIQDEQNEAHDAEFDKRLAALEQRSAEEKQSGAQVPAETSQPAAEQKQDTRMAQIVVGLTQLKTAYENDLSLVQGINTLKQAVNDNAVQENLKALSDLTGGDFPSKERILKQIADLQALLKTPAPTDHLVSGDWKTRAMQVVTHFVTVSKTEDLARKNSLNNLYDKMAQAVSFDNFTLASELAAKLPQDDAQSQALKVQLQTRLKTQQLVQKTVSAVGNALGQSQEGALY